MENIKELLEAGGLQTETHKIKLARHTLVEDQPEVNAVIQRSVTNFEEWQRVQGIDSQGSEFCGCDYVVSFCALPKTGARNLALFAGVFRNDNPPPRLNVERDLSPELAAAIPEKNKARYFFDFSRDSRFADWEGRVVADWGEGARRWVQDFKPDNPKEIIRVLPESIPCFTGDFQE